MDIQKYHSIEMHFDEARTLYPTKAAKARMHRERSVARRLCRRATIAGAALLLASATPACQAQVSFQDAIRLAVENSPRIKAAKNDLEKAQTGVAVVRDLYIPSAVVGGGAGYAYGITLNVPTVFTVTTQSLVFSFQQRQYMKAAKSDVEAAQLALKEVKEQVEEDAAITYLSLDSARQTAAALEEQSVIAERLASIMQDRLRVQLESELEVMKYHKGEIQIKLAKMQAEDSVEDLRAHLSQLTGIADEDLKIVPETIPEISPANTEFAGKQRYPDTPGILAAAASDRSKELRAKGDAEYTWRPNVGFGATYGRVSPIENVSEFYNLHGIYNTVSFGLSVQFPVLDMVRRAAARQTKLDTARGEMDLSSLRSDEIAGRRQMGRSLPELAMKSELADVNYEIAQDELKDVEAQAQHSTGTPPVTPKDVENARIDERQKYIEMLDAKLQQRKSEITFLRLTGQLDDWLGSLTAATAARP